MVVDLNEFCIFKARVNSQIFSYIFILTSHALDTQFIQTQAADVPAVMAIPVLGLHAWCKSVLIYFTYFVIDTSWQYYWQVFMPFTKFIYLFISITLSMLEMWNKAENAWKCLQVRKHLWRDIKLSFRSSISLAQMVPNLEFLFIVSWSLTNATFVPMFLNPILYLLYVFSQMASLKNIWHPNTHWVLCTTVVNLLIKCS